MDYITTFISDFFAILGEMAPYLLIGFFFAGVLYAFMPKQKIQGYFNGKALKSSVLAALLGVPLPLCSCGVIPTGIALYKNGASKGATVSFLISTPQTGVDSILATFSLLGLPFAIIRPLAALLTGISGGLITARLTPAQEQTESTSKDQEQAKNLLQKIKDVFHYGFVEFIQDISKWLIIGIVSAAIISALIPDDFFNLLNIPPILQMLIVLLASIPLYICATGSIPLAAILLLKGISPGAAFVLLMAGPATNAATITMIGKVMGKKSLFTYLGTIIVGALSFGLLIDYALPAEWFMPIANQHLALHHSEGTNWWQLASSFSLIALIINGYIQSHRTSLDTNTHNTTDMNTLSIKVEGMTCNHCKANVESHLKALDGIAEARADLNQKTVTIEGEHIEVEKVKASIRSLGYSCDS